jgi:hypothetical protein
VLSLSSVHSCFALNLAAKLDGLRPSLVLHQKMRCKLLASGAELYLECKSSSETTLSLQERANLTFYLVKGQL